MADFLDEKRSEITARLNELKPLVDEYARLEAAAAALEGLPAPAEQTAAPRRRSSNAGARGAARRGRPRGSGTRGTEALQLVRESPGITIPQIAEKLGMKQNYLYRVLPALVEDGLVTKQGRGWHPTNTA